MNMFTIILFLVVGVNCQLFLFPPAEPPEDHYFDHDTNSKYNNDEKLNEEYCSTLLAEKCPAGPRHLHQFEIVHSNLNITGVLHYYRSLVNAIFVNLEEQVTSFEIN